MLLWKDMYTRSLLIPYEAPPPPSTGSTLPRPSPSESRSLSSSPSPSHHTPLTQTSCPVTIGNGESADSAVEDESEDKPADDTIKVKGQNGIITNDRVVGDPKVDSPDEGEEHLAGGCGLVDGCVGVANDTSNGHLLTAEQRNGLISSSFDRELANVLTRQSPSSVIEMKDLAHVNGAMSHIDEQGHPPISPPLVDNSSSTVANTRSRSEPNFSQERTDIAQIQSSIVHVETMANSPAHNDKETETKFYGRSHSLRNDERGHTSALGVDGLPCSIDPVQRRVRELEMRHRRDVQELKSSLREARLQVATVTRLQELQKRKGMELGVGERGVAEGERVCNDGSRPSLHSDDMVRVQHDFLVKVVRCTSFVNNIIVLSVSLSALSLQLAQLGLR